MLTFAGVGPTTRWAVIGGVVTLTAVVAGGCAVNSYPEGVDSIPDGRIDDRCESIDGAYEYSGIHVLFEYAGGVNQLSDQAKPGFLSAAEAGLSTNKRNPKVGDVASMRIRVDKGSRVLVADGTLVRDGAQTELVRFPIACIGGQWMSKFAYHSPPLVSYDVIRRLEVTKGQSLRVTVEYNGWSRSMPLALMPRTKGWYKRVTDFRPVTAD